MCRSSLDPDADPSLAGCVPYNIFGDDVRDPDAPDFVNIDSVSHTKVTQQVVSGSLSGDFGSFMELPGGPIGFAVGAEYRKEKSDSVPALEIQDGLTWNGPVTPSRPAASTSRKLFAEVNLPVLMDAPYADRLSFGAAFRASRLQHRGPDQFLEARRGVRADRSVTLRGTYAQAVRAPNIAELFSPESTTFQFHRRSLRHQRAEQRHQLRVQRIAPRC